MSTHEVVSTPLRVVLRLHENPTFFYKNKAGREISKKSRNETSGGTINQKHGELNEPKVCHLILLENF